ncbi:MAG: TPM domain-containing protein, partial [Bacteroidales bacterium]|nr:TPM domain-containing protein [Bacteroidales bacterium]
MKKILFFFFSLLFILVGYSINSEIIEKPTEEKLVVDDAAFFNAEIVSSLEQKLEIFSKETSTQIAVVTVKTLNGYDIDDYAVRLLTQWGLGQKGKDNGIVVLIKPKTADGKGQVAISVGYGLEGVVPDAVAKRIVENEVIPAFKKGQYGQGVEKAVNVLMELTKGEYT